MKSQKRVQSPACLSTTSEREGTELAAAALSPTAGVVGELEAAGWGRKDGCV
jgi:hypothetical protein